MKEGGFNHPPQNQFFQRSNTVDLLFHVRPTNIEYPTSTNKAFMSLKLSDSKPVFARLI